MAALRGRMPVAVSRMSILVRSFSYSTILWLLQSSRGHQCRLMHITGSVDAGCRLIAWHGGAWRDLHSTMGVA